MNTNQVKEEEMKHLQGTYIKGYVTVLIKGNMPELFFQKCNSAGIPVWNVKKTASDACLGNIKLSDINSIKKLRRKTNYKLSFVQKSGYPFLIKRFFQKKQLFVGILMSLALIVFLSNIIWEVKVTGVPKDIEEKISKQLDSYGIHSGAWIFTLDSPNAIQQRLVNDIPELLWVGVDQKGTTFFLEGVEKTIVKEEKPKGPQNLVATKKGVIKKMYVTKGLPKVQVNDYVEPGKVLVSGIIDDEVNNETEDTNKNKKKADLVAADGEITAITWYEVSVTVPLHADHELLTGEKEKKYGVQLGKVQLPVWGFGKPEYKNIHRETNEKSLRFFKWELPVKIVETILSEKMYNKVERSKEEAIDIGILQARKELQLELGPDAKIMSEKVLHETSGRGKVKLNLYISVEEDITRSQPIKDSTEEHKNQGD